MARAIVTPEAVAEAAQALLASGQEPTVILIQERTGGSFTTVKRHLDAWKTAQAAPQVAVPEAITAAGEELLRHVWQAAAKQIAQAQAEAEETAQAQIGAIRAQLAEAETAIARLEQQLDEAEARRQKAETFGEEQRQRAERAEAAQTALERRITQLEAEQTEAERRQREEGEAQLKALQMALIEQRQLIERLLPEQGGDTPPTRRKRS